MIYQHPLAYLLGLEGLALLRAWAGDHDYDQDFVTARLAEVRELLDDPLLTDHPGVLVEPDATPAAYEQWSPGYDDPGNPLFDLDEPLIDSIIGELPVGTAVDTACGTGRLTAHVLERGHRVIGVDSSLAMVQRARNRLPGTTFLVGDLLRLPLPDESADLIVNGLALTHVADLEAVLIEAARVLRPGGHLVVSDVHHDLVLLGSVVKAAGAAGQPQIASTHRHTTAEFLIASLAAGFQVLGYDERPRPAKPDGPLPEPTRDVGSWRDWPWTLLGRVPEATRAAWNNPSVVVWHLQRKPDRRSGAVSERGDLVLADPRATSSA